MQLQRPQPLFDSTLWIADQPCSRLRSFLVELDIVNIEQEYMLAKRFLLSYQGSDDTFNSYRREVERVCQWAWMFRKKPIKALDRHDLSAYFDFVQKPPALWVARKHSQRFTTNSNGERMPCDNWRPFLNRHGDKTPDQKKMQLTQSAMRAIIAGTSTFFTYLMQENYISANPVSLIRQKSKYLQKNQQSRVTRKLSDAQWTHLIEEIQQRCLQQPIFERHLFIFSAFYLLGCRISELVDSPGRKPIMSDFYQDSHGLWWFKTVGKGNKAREIAVPDAMLEALRRYRHYLGMTAQPSANDQTPIIPKKKGEGGIGIRQLRKIVQVGFDCTVERLIESGANDEADSLRQATVHWLRHTAISKDVQFRPREHVRDDAGHQSVQVTDRYIEIDLQARHASARSKTLSGQQNET